MKNQDLLSGAEKVLDEATLVDQLNTLLASLHLPISLISPTDLTPSLLVAILESLLGMRIPMFEREGDAVYNAKTSKVQNMKIFLGVLETDILKMDVGLSDVDPRRLADGDDEEVLYIAELLCWIGRRMNSARNRFYRRRPKSPQWRDLPEPGTSQAPIRPLSPKSQLDLDAESLFQTGSTQTGSTKQSYPGLFSPFFKGDEESMTSLFSDLHHEQSESEDGYSDGVSDILSALPPFTNPNASSPRCIHEIPSPSLLFSVELDPTPPRQSKSGQSSNTHEHHPKGFCDCDASVDVSLPIEHDHPGDRSHTSVRYSGFIQPVDEEFEIASFEHSRSMSSTSSTAKNNPLAKIESVKKQYTRTLELLNERTQLLTQLSELKRNSHG